MLEPHVLLLAGVIALLAGLYACVGHGGASGYLAAMALAGLSPLAMRPTALVLNVVVAGMASVKFFRAGHFDWPSFARLAGPSVPMAFIGGLLTLPSGIYAPVVGMVLLVAALQLLRPIQSATTLSSTTTIPFWPAAISGAGIGLLSGMTGVGGAIFLSPLLLLAGWALPRRTAALAAAFVLVNSIAGLAGHLTSVQNIPAGITLWAPAGFLGAWIGTQLGMARMGHRGLQLVLSAVLLIAAAKLLLQPIVPA